MGVDDAGHRSGGGLSGRIGARIYVIGEAVHHITGDLIAHVADKRGHGQPGHRVTPTPSIQRPHTTRPATRPHVRALSGQASG